MAHAGGRPTLYTPDLCKKAEVYLKINRDKMLKTGLEVKLPTLDDFSTFLNVSLKSLYEWEGKYPEFSQALDSIRKEQKKRLLNSGLNGRYNSTIAKLILSSNHGMSEKTDTSHSLDYDTRNLLQSAIDKLGGNRGKKD